MKRLGVLILAFLWLSCTTRTSDQNANNMASEIALMGIEVTESFLSDPRIRHGEFRLENGGNAAISADVEAVRLQTGEESRAFETWHLLDVGTGQPIEGAIEVPPDSAVQFLLSFETVPYQPRMGAVALHCSIAAGDSTYEAASPIRIINRIPR